MSSYIVHKAVEVKNFNKRSALALKLKETPDGRLREPVLLGVRNDVLTPD